MATFDQLPADQRAIIELVLKRGRSYEQLSDLLGMPEARVRELAREALVSLAPVTATKVDDEWRNQIADYTLGQQSGAESVATQGHLRRSETARAWLGSLLDSLEQLYGDAALPDLPESDGSTERPRARDRRPARGDDDRSARERRRSTAAVADAEPAEDDADDDAGAGRDDRVQRNERRLIFGGTVLVVLVVILLLLLTGVLGGGDDDGGGGDSQNAGDTTAAPDADGAANSQTQILGEMALKPVADDAAEDTVGIAQIASDGKQTQVGIRAKLPQVASRHAYEVWLFNSRRDAVSLGAARTDAQGNFEGAAPLPEGYEKYKFIDISDEPVNKDTDHSGKSVLRGAFADLVTPEQQQQQGEQPAP
jgi:hypothetical protein